jgi:hypothetical protein
MNDQAAIDELNLINYLGTYVWLSRRQAVVELQNWF